ncbi:MAG: hypothetical protein JSW52_02730 [Candidatus Coatesbacteria bacterium]|nr:MAG: hypothetical protein JSW52_02730 [Candidatus Coatesbacteria bacterium]
MKRIVLVSSIIVLLMAISAGATVEVTAETDVGLFLIKLPDASRDAELPVKGILFFYELTGLGPDYDPYTGVYALPVPCEHPSGDADIVYREHVKIEKETKGFFEKKSSALVNTARLLNYDTGRYGVFEGEGEFAVSAIIEKGGAFFFVEGYVPTTVVEKYPEIEEALKGIVLSARFVE